MMRKEFLIICVFLFGVFLLIPETVKAEEGSLLIADFNDCKKPNQLGGGFGAWDRAPSDFTQTAMISFINSIKHGGEGCSLQVYYDVDSPDLAYNGFWMKLDGIDANEYSKLTMWVKGDTKMGYTNVFKVELKNDLAETGKVYITGITDEWKKFEINFKELAGITDFSSLNEFVIVFEDRIATSKEGAIYIDDIKLEK